jgi:hypothetical protein
MLSSVSPTSPSCAEHTSTAFHANVAASDARCLDLARAGTWARYAPAVVGAGAKEPKLSRRGCGVGELCLGRTRGRALHSLPRVWRR